jgi:hypothetical protein
VDEEQQHKHPASFRFGSRISCVTRYCATSGNFNTTELAINVPPNPEGFVNLCCGHVIGTFSIPLREQMLSSSPVISSRETLQPTVIGHITLLTLSNAIRFTLAQSTSGSNWFFSIESQRDPTNELKLESLVFTSFSSLKTEDTTTGLLILVVPVSRTAHALQ